MPLTYGIWRLVDLGATNGTSAVFTGCESQQSIKMESQRSHAIDQNPLGTAAGSDLRRAQAAALVSRALCVNANIACGS